MWFGIWASRRADEPRFRLFRKHYEEFRDEDIVWLCADHHAEIHREYDSVIQLHKFQTGKPLYKYTWKEAEDLMDKLEEYCNSWLERVTEGYSHDALELERRRRKHSR